MRLMVWCPRPRGDITRPSLVSTCAWSGDSSARSCPKATGPPAPTCSSSATAPVTCLSATTPRHSSCHPPPARGGSRPTSSRFPDATSRLRRSARQQRPPELRHPPPHRPVVDPLADPDDGATQDLRVDRERREHLLPEMLAQAVLDRAPERFIGGPRQGDASAHSVELEIEQLQILPGDLAEQQLPPALDHRLQKEHELPGCILERRTEEPGL